MSVLYLPGVIKTGLENILQIFSQLPLSNSLFTVLFAYVVFLLVLWLGICVEVGLDRTAILPPPPPPLPPPPLRIFPYPQFFLLTQVTVI